MSDPKDAKQDVDPFKPYKGRFESYPRIPEKGRDREDIYQELAHAGNTAASA